MPYKNPEKHKAALERYKRAAAAKRAKVREIVQKHKNKPCVDCGIQYPYWVMQHDHCRGTKGYEISSVQRNPSHKAIADLPNELAKCDVVCANCHALRHPPF